MFDTSRLAGSGRSAVLAAGIALAVASAAATAAFPDKPIRFVVTFPPGGSTDVVARIIARPVSEALGQPVVVENRPGAGGTIGTEAVAKAAPDGYTIGVFAGSHSTSAALFRKLRFDPLADFAPIGQVVSLPFFLLVSPKIEAKSIKELLELAKTQPISYGSGGNGNTMHLAGELMSKISGVKLQHVPYKGGGPAVVDLLGGQISMLIAPVDIAYKNIQSGKLRALGVAGKTRFALTPSIPTMAESGLPGYEVTSWVGVMAPARTPRDIVMRLSAEIRKAIASKEVNAQLMTLGAEPVDSNPEQFAAFLKEDIGKWKRIVQDAGLQPLD
jgi:tripartite-type tricarboxylate transporter receptor subunit TctC